MIRSQVWKVKDIERVLKLIEGYIEDNDIYDEVDIYTDVPDRKNRELVASIIEVLKGYIHDSESE